MDNKTALIWATQKLNKTTSPELDAEILLAFVLHKDKVWLFSHPETGLTKPQETKFKKLILKRAKLFPIAYLTGAKEFYGFNFKITPDVLVPRPLTEELVDQALKFIKNTKKRPLTIADIGTGSGCIIISLIKELQKLNAIPAKSWPASGGKKFTFYATDISAKALAVAKKNAKFYGLSKNIRFYKGDLLKPLLNKKVDLILTNPPYLTKAHFKKEKSIQREPKIALIGSPRFAVEAGNPFKKLFSQIQKTSAKGGLASGQKIPVTIMYEDLEGIHQKKFNPNQTK